jgi:putative phosphoribosyl transferase
MIHLFADREDAGRQLADALLEKGWDRPPLKPDLILGLARGGVVLAQQVAQALKAPWDVLIVRKLGAPQDPELGVGALCEDGSPLFSKFWMQQLHLKPEDLDSMLREKQAELHQKIQLYRGFPLPLLPVPQRVCIVDDGLATGVSAEAAAAYLRRHGVSQVLLAVPVGDPETVLRLESPGKLYDTVVCLERPGSLGSVGSWYQDFSQVSDAEVIDHLRHFEREAQN